MTTQSASPSGTTTSPYSRSRVVAVTRLHFVNAWTVLIIPAMILGFILLANIAIWWIILGAVGPDDRVDARDGFSYSGATFYVFVYMMVVAIQVINVTFAYAMGFGVTRRDFYLGTTVAFVLMSALWALVMTALAAIEDLTGGWFLGGRMFTAIYFDADTWGGRFLMYFLVFLFFFFVGSAIASIYVRWKLNGTLVFFALLTVALIAAVAAVTFTGNWPAVGAWFVANGPLGVATWTLIPTAAASLLGYAVLRKATPRA